MGRLRVHSEMLAGVEHLPQRGAGFGAEQAERLGLRGGDAERGVLHATGAQVGRGHHGELVDRQRPRRLARDGEDEPAQLAAFDAVEDRCDLGRLAGPREGDGALHSRARHGADRDDEDVVAQIATAAEHDGPCVGKNGMQRSASELCALVTRQRLEVQRGGAAEAERLGDRRGTVDETRLGREQRDRHLLAHEMTQGEQGLDRRHAGARDDDVRARRADIPQVATALRHVRLSCADPRAPRSRARFRAGPRSRGRRRGGRAAGRRRRAGRSRSGRSRAIRTRAGRRRG